MAPGRPPAARCHCVPPDRPGYGLVRDRPSRNHRRLPRGVVRALSGARGRRRAPARRGHRVPRGPRRDLRERGLARSGRHQPGPFIRMVPGVPGTDRWHATVVPTGEGAWTFAVEAWGDPVATWRHKVEVKIDAGQGPEDLANDLEDGARLLLRALRNVPTERRGVLEAAAEALRDTRRDLAHRVGPALTAEVTALLEEHPVRELLTRSPRYTVWVDRKKALFSAWYELFPRSEGAENRAGRHPGPARHVQGRGPPAAADRPAGLRRRLPAADPPDRQGQPQGPEQHADARPGGRRLALGDRLRRGRARRDPPAAGHVRGLRRLRRARPASRAWRSRSTWPCRPRRTTPG